MKIRTPLVTALWSICFVAIAAMSPAAFAQGAFPSKPIRIIVPFAPGGTSDVLARALGQKLSEIWKQPVVVENRPGAGGNIGAVAVARAEPDGHTLLLMDVATITIGPSINPNLGYDPIKDFAPVTMVAFSPHVLAVHPSVPAKTVKELIAYAKANPDALNFASAGNGTAVQLAGEQFKMQAGINMTQIPYKSGAPTLTRLGCGEGNVTPN